MSRGIRSHCREETDVVRIFQIIPFSVTCENIFSYNLIFNKIR